MTVRCNYDHAWVNNTGLRHYLMADTTVGIKMKT